MTKPNAKPGQFWKTRGGEIAFVAFDARSITQGLFYPLIVFTKDGMMSCLTDEGREIGRHNDQPADLVEHLPNHTSFDDPPEAPMESEWPKWYVHKNDSLMFFVKRISSETAMYCEKEEKTRFDWGELESRRVAAGGWLEVTESEALARISPQIETSDATGTPGMQGESDEAAVDDPDEWVPLTTIGHILRPVDQCDFIENEGSDSDWKYCNASVGMQIDDGDGMRYRCKRRDLLPMPQPQPETNRVPVRLLVRLWSESNTGYVICDTGNSDLSHEADEIHSDGNGGWFVEVPK